MGGKDGNHHHSTTVSPPHQNPLLRRRSSSISASIFPTPTNLILPRQSSASATFLSSDTDLEPLYTSLRDLLPNNSSGPDSPAHCLDSTGSQISIRNRLVKQAAWAYLQPMSSTPTNLTSQNLFKRLWLKFSRKNPVVAVFRFFSRVLDWVLSAIRIRSSR